MGAVDQSDVKAQIMGLVGAHAKLWSQKQLYFLTESAIINAHANYNLDPSVQPETFTN